MADTQSSKHEDTNQTNSSGSQGNKSLSEVLSGKRARIEESTNWDSGDWGEYMKIKQRKLHDQFRGLDAPNVSSIFEGVTIYVNGWTQPNADELKEMIHSHGGNYEFNLYSNSKVTHTIATNLPNAKIKNLGNSVVCTPAWIVDSIAAGQQLPVERYVLYRQGGGQQRRLAFDKIGKKTEQAGVPPQSSVPSSEQQCEDELSADRENEGLLTSVAKAYQPSQGAQFVSDFFTHSRLHYLSTWSTELKQFTAKMLKQISPKHPKLSGAESLRVKGQRAVVHIDLDCFFVSVSIRDKPHLKGKPVAVTHAKLPKSHEKSLPSDQVDTSETSSKDSLPKHLLDSTSDIASCSYAARDSGVCNGMSVGEAMKLCPNLILLSYDFEAYRQVSQCFYEILLQYSSCVEAVSCDEAYIEFTDYVSDFKQVEELVLELRNEIEAMVGCTVSAGISHNMLLARMCTRVAKPNGQYCLPLSDTQKFLESQNVRHLPGVGYSTTRKLNEMSIETCSQLNALSLEKLQDTFGPKTGKILYEFARGIDSRELKTATERKSVSVDINYGIRFKEMSEAESLIANLAKELEKRAADAEVVGGTVVLKMKVRRPTAPLETWKYLGHGACDNVTRSFTLLQPTRSAVEVSRLAIRLLKQIKPVASDIRGMGLQLSKLVSLSSGESGSAQGMDLRNFMKPDSNREKTRLDCPPVSQIKSTTATPLLSALYPPASTGATGADVSAPAPPKERSFVIDLPPLSQLDNSVLDALPAYLRDEILKEYASKQENQPSTSTATSIVELTESFTGPVNKEPRVSTVQSIGAKGQQVTEHTSPDSEQVVIQNESLFLRDMRSFVKEWIISFIEGPLGEDVAVFSEYMLRLAMTSLEVVTLILKTMRRFIVSLELGAWCSVFNCVLAQLQHRVKSLYSGHLLINPL